MTEPMVEVVWLDSTSWSGWLDPDIDHAKKADLSIRTAGLLAFEEEDRIGILQSRGILCVGELLVIPRCAIVSIYHLRKARA